MVQQFRAHEVFQILMVAQNLDRVARTLPVGPPFLKSPDDCHEFLIVDFIIAFPRAVLFGVKGHWMPNTIGVVLGENAGRDIVRSVGFDYYFSVVVKVMENGCWCKCFFEEVEGCLLLWSPHKWNVFASLLFCHSGQRRHHFGVILY